MFVVAAVDNMLAVAAAEQYVSRSFEIEAFSPFVAAAVDIEQTWIVTNWVAAAVVLDYKFLVVDLLKP